MTDHLYREIEDLRSKNRKLSVALADMIEMYEQKKRNGIRLGKARACLVSHGDRPTALEPTTSDRESKP